MISQNILSTYCCFLPYLMFYYLHSFLSKQNANSYHTDQHTVLNISGIRNLLYVQLKNLMPYQFGIFGPFEVNYRLVSKFDGV